MSWMQGTPIKAAFAAHAAVLDDENDRKERIVKLSRDLTIGSKRLIFLLLRQGDEDKMKQAGEALCKLHKLIGNIATEVRGRDYWRYQRAFSPGLQEYIEALSLYHFLNTSRLITKTEIERRIEVDNKGQQDNVTSQQPFFSISHEDYLLGIADLSGELMRLAIGNASAGDATVSEHISEFLKQLYHNFEGLAVSGSFGLDAKVKVMEGSVYKVESLCLAQQVQGKEVVNQMVGL